MIYKRKKGGGASSEFCQISSLDLPPYSVSPVSRGAGALIDDCIVIGLQPWFKGVITAGNGAQFPPSEHSWTPAEDQTDGKLLGASELFTIASPSFTSFLLPKLFSVSLPNTCY